MTKVELEDKHLITIIANMARDIWREYYAGILPHEQIEYMLHTFQSDAAIAKQIETGELAYYAIERGGEYAGYFAVGVKDGIMFLSKLYIYKRFRLKGLAREAVKFISKLAREQKIKTLALTVNKNNLPAIEAYTKLGFVKEKETATDIGEGFVMDDYYLTRKVK